jgi:hypothetical protein
MTSKSIQSRSASYRLLLAEVLQNDTGLEDASSELQDDRDVVLHCVRRCPAAIEHASARLRGDKEIILAAATGEYDEALKFASAELQDDWDFVLHLVKVPWRGDAVKYASARLRGDKEIILAAIEEGFSMFALKYASSELQDDREFVLECVQLAPNGSHAIYHASDRLRGDKEIILAAGRKCSSDTVLNLASTELQDDRDVVLRCVELKPDAIKYASSRLRGDEEIILAAKEARANLFALSRLRGDKEIILAAEEARAYLFPNDY